VTERPPRSSRRSRRSSRVALRAVIGLAVVVGGLTASFALSAMTARPARAAAGDDALPRRGHALMFVIDGVSVPELTAIPVFRQLARSGGLGLMTTRVPSGPADRRTSSYLTIGAGAPLADRTSLLVRLMARALSNSGVAVCSAPAGPPQNYIGGGGCQPNGGGDTAETTVVRLPAPPAGGTAAERAARLRADAGVVRSRIAGLGTARSLVMVVVPVPSPAMDARGDEVTPLILAEGPASSLLPKPNGVVHALTSASTRRTGLVANTDVAPTVLRFFGVPIPSDMSGDPVETTSAAAPFGLYRLELQYRHIRFPVQLLELAFVIVAGILAIGVLFRLRSQRTIAPKAAARIRLLMYSAVAFPTAILSGGLLPRMTYLTAIGWLVLVSVGLGLLATRIRYPGPYPAFGFLGAVGLAFIALDLVFGSHALRMPLVGGVMFDGARFYGMPNFADSPLLASALFVAAGLSVWWGTGVVVAAALLAGLPWFGADIGGAVALFTAAGLWFGTRRTNGRMRASVVGWGAGFVAVGTALVLAANRFLSVEPTHATRFVGLIGSRVSSFFGTIAHRLGIGGHQFLSVPLAVLPMAGLIALIAIVGRRPEPVRAALRDRVWRSLIGILSVSALVAYLANDTGVTAAAPAFLYGMAALVVPTLAVFEGAPPPKRRPPPKRKPQPATGVGEAVTVGPGAPGQGPSQQRRRRKRGRRR
jgi:hypothetical protein